MFRSVEQRNLVAQTLFGAFGAANWWTADGPTPRALTLMQERDANTSAMVLADLAFGMIDYRHPALTIGGYMTLDEVNRALVGSLLNAMGQRQSAEYVDIWLSAYEHYRAQTQRR
jgi:hypothetical protein